MALFKAQFAPSTGAAAFAQGMQFGSTAGARQKALDEKARQFDEQAPLRDATTLLRENQARIQDLTGFIMDRTLGSTISRTNAENEAGVQLAATSVEQANLNVAIGQASLMGTTLANFDALVTGDARRAAIVAQGQMATTQAEEARLRLEDFKANSLLRGEERKAALAKMRREVTLAEAAEKNVAQEVKLASVTLSGQIAQAVGTQVAAESLVDQVEGLEGQLPDYVYQALLDIRADTDRFKGNKAAQGMAMQGVLQEYAQGSAYMFARTAITEYQQLQLLLSDPDVARTVSQTELSAIQAAIDKNPAMAVADIRRLTQRAQTAKNQLDFRTAGLNMLADTENALRAAEGLDFNTDALPVELRDQVTTTAPQWINDQQTKLMQMSGDGELNDLTYSLWLSKTMAPFRDSEGNLPEPLKPYQSRIRRAERALLLEGVRAVEQNGGRSFETVREQAATPSNQPQVGAGTGGTELTPEQVDALVPGSGNGSN